MLIKIKDGEKVKIGQTDYVWRRSGSRWSFRPEDKREANSGFSVIAKTMTASDGSKFKKPMSVQYIENIRNRNSSGGKYKSAGSFGADIRR